MTTLESDDSFSVVKTNRLYIGTDTAVTEIQSDGTGLLFDKPLSVTNYLQLNNLTDSSTVPAEPGKLTLYAKDGKLSYKTVDEDLAFGTTVGNLGDIQFTGTDGFSSDPTFNFDTVTKTLKVQSIVSPDFNTPLSINYLDETLTTQTAMSIQDGTVTFGNVLVDMSDSALENVDRIQIAANNVVTQLGDTPTIQSYTYVDTDATINTNNVAIKPSTQGDLVVITSPSTGIYEQSLRVRDNGATNYKRQVIHHNGFVNIQSTGTVKEGTATTVTLADDESSIDDTYNGSWIIITAGLGINQIRKVFDYDGSTKIVTIQQNWNIIPDNTSIYELYQTRSHPYYTISDKTRELSKEETGAICIGIGECSFILPILGSESDEGLHYTLKTNDETELVFRNTVVWPKLGQTTLETTTLTPTQLTFIFNSVDDIWIDFVAINNGGNLEWQAIMPAVNFAAANTQWWSGGGVYINDIPSTDIAVSEPEGELAWRRVDGVDVTGGIVAYDNEYMYVYGGYTGGITGTLTDVLYRVNPNDGTVVTMTQNVNIGNRAGGMMVMDGDNLWLIGGYDGTSYVNTVHKGVITDTSIIWTNETPGSGMNPRGYAKVFYDSNSDNIVVFGGRDDSVTYSDSWVYSVDSGGWTNGTGSIMPNFDPTSATPNNTEELDTTSTVTTVFGSNTVTLTGDTQPDGYYVGRVIYSNGQFRRVVTYLSEVVTVDVAWTSIPVDRTRVVIYGAPTTHHITTVFGYNTVTLTGDTQPDGYYVNWHVSVGKGEYLRVVSYVNTVATLEKSWSTVPANGVRVDLFEYLSVGRVADGGFVYNGMDRVGYLVGGSSQGNDYRSSLWRLEFDTASSKFRWYLINYEVYGTRSDFSNVLGGVKDCVVWEKFGLVWVMAFDRLGLYGAGKSNDLWSYGSSWEYKDGSVNAYVVTQFTASDTKNIVEGVESDVATFSHNNYPAHAVGYAMAAVDERLVLVGGEGFREEDTSPIYRVYRSTIQPLTNTWLAPI